MTRAIDEFELAWGSLLHSPDTEGWRAIPVAGAGACQLAAGRRKPGNEEAMLAKFPGASVPAAERLPEGEGFAIERVDLMGDGATWLGLSRKPSGRADMFAAMVGNVAGALDNEPVADAQRLLRVFLGRVRAWQEFMRKGAQPLGPEAEVGLIGELLALSAIIDAGIPAAIACEAWLGPLDGLRDFEIGTGGIEVKATLGAVGFPAKIGSLDQLDDTVRQPLFVAAVRLRQAADGASLPEHVETLRDIARGDLEAERLLAERLVATGYFDAHADKYSRRFVASGMRVLEVMEGFPRLTPGRVPSGVSRASYEIDLDRTPGASLGIEAALRKLGAL
jgi:hypothetical protein